ncbi:hypothetical protein [Polyangium aurulentum]|uniref:hypothetical protein n=1 Tax=Polyangium aurulentum TaxID=2567896 RepID=UPI0010AEC456|nr:hypothetical protein [Polyangium aurulentum]UQA60407.1 hypothetical protein E8A73_008010 [Polyangium aurulentum]
MTTTNPDGRAQDINQILAYADANGETAAPVDDDEDTAGPEDDDNDVAGAELEAEDGDTGDIKALKKRGRHMITLEEARALQARARKRGARVGKRRAQKQPSPPQVKLPPNMVPPGAGARHFFEKWTRNGDPFVVRQDGHYYAVTEIVCPVEGTGTRAWARLQKGEYRFFDRAVGDETRLMGTTTQVTTNLTNLQRPSKNTYNDQDFLIRSITMQEAGLRVRYDPAEVKQIAGIGTAEPVLTGQAWLWDDAGTFLPKEIFHDFSGDNLLYRALRRSAVLYFSWDKRRVGGNGTMRRVLIDHLRNVPDTKVKMLSRTSGGSPVLTVPDGYIFSDNPERSDDGAFSAHIDVEEDIVFPVKPIDIGAGSPSKPLEIGLYVQLSLNGMSFEHKRRAQPTG